MKRKLLFFAPLLALVMLVVCAVPAMALTTTTFVPPPRTTITGLGTFISGESNGQGNSRTGNMGFSVLATFTGTPTNGPLTPVLASGIMVLTNNTDRWIATGTIEGAFPPLYDTEDVYMFGHCYLNRVKYYFEVLYWKSPAAKVDIWIDTEHAYTGGAGNGFVTSASHWYRGNVTKGCIQIKTTPPPI